jgi:flagellar basal-body rod protein FlgG
MNSSMISASVSLGALQQKLDLLADNVANSNTAGYKRKSVVFEDILTGLQAQEQDFEQPGRRTPLGFTIGSGARLSGMQLDLSQGVLQQTGNMTDLAIEGNALFEVRTGGTIDGGRAFSRQGALQLVPVDGGDRMLMTNTGYPVVSEQGGSEQFVTVPDGYNLSIGSDGTLTAVGAEGSEPIELGKLRMVEVTKPELLQAVADNLYGVPSDVNVEDVVRNVTEAAPGEASWTVRQGYLENSNVDMTKELTDLVLVQRAYQLSARALTSGDQMMGFANNLRG